jgi:hypothetical protein
MTAEEVQAVPDVSSAETASVTASGVGAGVVEMSEVTMPDVVSVPDIAEPVPVIDTERVLVPEGMRMSASEMPGTASSEPVLKALLPEASIAPTDTAGIPIPPPVSAPTLDEKRGRKMWSREYIGGKIVEAKEERGRRLAQIASEIRTTGAVTIKEIRAKYHVTRQTAYSYVRELVKNGLAVRKKVISFVRPEKK